MTNFVKKLSLLAIIFFTINSQMQISNVFASDETGLISNIVINDEISLDIYVPSNATNSNGQYPTMYVMDSQHYFYNAIAFQKSLRNGVNVSPQFIVVGINTQKISDVNRRRFQILGPNADEMISLLENEIIPHIDANYPTTTTRMYFGWQFAAGFGLELFSKKPQLIEGYFLASSPTFTQTRLVRTLELLKNSKGLDNYFYLSLGSKETHATENHQQLVEGFQESNNHNLKWFYSLSNNYNHQTTPLDSFTNGLSWYFSDYPDITFFSLKEIDDFGGVAAVKKYYKDRGARYKIDPAVGEQALLSMFRHAAREENWETFQHFESELGELELVEHAADGWYFFFGDFYIANNALSKAERLFKRGLTFYPSSHGLWAALAGVYEKQNKKASALDSYQNALSHTNPDEDAHLNYKKQIELLQ